MVYLFAVHHSSSSFMTGDLRCEILVGHSTLTQLQKVEERGPLALFWMKNLEQLTKSWGWLLYSHCSFDNAQPHQQCPGKTVPVGGKLHVSWWFWDPFGSCHLLSLAVQPPLDFGSPSPNILSKNLFYVLFCLIKLAIVGFCCLQSRTLIIQGRKERVMERKFWKAHQTSVKQEPTAYFV